MVSDETQNKTTKTIRDSLEWIKIGIPQLTVVVEAFEELLVAKSVAKSQISTPGFLSVEIDLVRFSQGVPVLDDRKIEVNRDSLRKVALLIIPAIKKGFPKMADDLSRLESFVINDETAMEQLQPALESGSSTILGDMAVKLGIPLEILQFVCSELAKPFAEKARETIAPMIDGQSWLKGYCPVCGAWPTVSVLKGNEGRRFLNCSVCGHEWNYMRTQCPFCENSDTTKQEIIFSEDRKFEYAELCHSCKKYIVGLDTRNLISIPHPYTTPIELIYLDILAQERGFTPGATVSMFRDLTL
jgi:FdhE protein